MTLKTAYSYVPFSVTCLGVWKLSLTKCKNTLKGVCFQGCLKLFDIFLETPMQRIKNSCPVLV